MVQAADGLGTTTHRLQMFLVTLAYQQLGMTTAPKVSGAVSVAHIRSEAAVREVNILSTTGGLPGAQLPSPPHAIREAR